LESIFPIQLNLPVVKLLQDEEEELDDMKRRIEKIIEVQ
jgi:hypothetical protein